MELWAGGMGGPGGPAGRGVMVNQFHRAVFRMVRTIPRGRVMTYGQIAALLGAPRAARAVGYAMRHCPPGVPWQRVVNAQGGISLRANVDSMLTQRILLEQEGVTVRRGRIALDRYRWRSAPAQRLRLGALDRL